MVAVGFMKSEGGAEEEDNAGIHGEVEFVLLECNGAAAYGVGSDVSGVLLD